MSLSKLEKMIFYGAVFGLILQSVLFGQQKILFRYNSDYGQQSSLQSGVTLKEININERTTDEDELARGPDGWGYSTRQTSYFYDDSSAIISTENVSLSLFGNLQLSGELWLKSFAADGTLFCWDDSAKANGFNLFLQDGHVTLHSRIMNTNYELTANSPIELNSWTYFNWSCAVNGDSIQQCIYVNGQLDICSRQKLVSNLGFAVFSAPVAVGFSVQNTLPVTNFSGELYAANLKSYIPNETYLNAHIPKDGSAYLGIVNYHDYPLDGAEKNIDLRISENPTPIIDAAFVPYLNDSFIPQGITNSFEDENYSDPDGMIYISLYHKTVDGVIRQQRSIIVEIDPQQNYRVRRCFRLRGVQQTKHNGGIAYRDGYIYVASSYNIERYPLPEYADDGAAKYQDLTTAYTNVYQVNSQASFMTYFQDSVWVGDYRTSSQSDPYLFGYPLDAQGNVNISANPKVYRLPYQTQGVAWKEYNREKYLFISNSGGDAGSRVSRYHVSKLSRTAIPQPDEVFNIPAGGEDLSFDREGNLLNVSESGAIYFQKRSSPWSSFYPFVFIISEQVVMGDLYVSDVKITQQENQPRTFQLYQNFPNPFNPQTIIAFNVEQPAKIAINIYNIRGEKIRSLLNSDYSPGHYQTLWDGTTDHGLNAPSGVYFYKLTTADGLSAIRKMILLK